MVKVVLASLVLAACYSSAQLETQRHTEIDRVANEGYAQLVVPACTSASTTMEPPGMTIHRFPNGQEARVGCGLVLAKLLAPAEMQRFVAEICHGVDDDVCSGNFVQMFLAQLRERYTFADWSAVEERCTAHPIDCKQWVNIELWAIDSHDDGVVKHAKAQMNGVNDRYFASEAQQQAEHDRHMAAIGAVLQGAAQGMAEASQQPQTVNCTSNTIGTSTYTSCR
ncbi:MAG TPA: hypothetical protein VGG74_11585 [Kofleriaceae bacterium]|jgi:hypothetical protein